MPANAATFDARMVTLLSWTMLSAWSAGSTSFGAQTPDRRVGEREPAAVERGELERDRQAETGAGLTSGLPASPEPLRQC